MKLIKNLLFSLLFIALIIKSIEKRYLEEEKEQPELNEETKKLISLYHRDPTEENYLNLVINNYNKVLAKKENKLSELKIQTEGKPGGEEIVADILESYK